MSDHVCEFVPVINVLVDFDALRGEDVCKGLQTSTETACNMCGEPGPFNLEQPIFMIDP